MKEMMLTRTFLIVIAVRARVRSSACVVAYYVGFLDFFFSLFDLTVSSFFFLIHITYLSQQRSIIILYKITENMFVH